MPSLLRSFCLLLLLCPPMLALAQGQSLTIEIRDGRPGATPIAVVPFAWESAGVPDLANDIPTIIRSNLNRVGRFRALPREDYVELPSRGEQINFATWRMLKQDYIVVGRVLDGADNTYRIEFELFRVLDQSPMLRLALPARPGDMRAAAHQISDLIYEKITGVRGAFWTRIAYITATGRDRNVRYRLMVADSDGYNEQPVVQSNEPLMSPTWSPDGKQLAYVSFERGNSAVFVQEIATGARRLISGFKGINSAPAFSPDGGKLALVLSRSGNPEINVLDLASNTFTQLTRHFAIDTEPQWTPDGQHIVFTSDRAGRPQLYRMPAAGGEATRITFQGEYNARATISYDGNKIGMVQGNDNVYRIAVLDRERGDPGVVRVITDGRLDESPSFAPNASMLLYASQEGTRGVLYAVAVDGSVRQRLAYAEGDVREPAWSPFRQR